MTVHGHVENGVVVLDNGAALPDGTLVQVTTLPHEAGNALAVIAAMENSPKVPAEWVDELEQAIAAGRRPPSPPITFADEPASRENG